MPKGEEKPQQRVWLGGTEYERTVVDVQWFDGGGSGKVRFGNQMIKVVWFQKNCWREETPGSSRLQRQVMRVMLQLINDLPLSITVSDMIEDGELTKEMADEFTIVLHQEAQRVFDDLRARVTLTGKKKETHDD